MNIITDGDPNTVENNLDYALKLQEQAMTELTELTESEDEIIDAEKLIAPIDMRYDWEGMEANAEQSN